MRRTMRQSIRREHVVMGVKAALGASVSIGLAMLLHLQYAATAGVICILSLMGTKMETLRIARGRLLALATGTLMAAACYHALGFSLLGFTVYLFIFAVMCYACRWGYAVTLVSVLMSHFMAYGEMTVPLLANEGLLFLIGTGVGILVNLHLRPDEEKMRRHMQTVDEMMRAAMHAISRGAEGLPDARQVLDALKKELTQAERLAIDNADNTFGDAPLYPVRYVQMRANQRKILVQMLQTMERVDAATPQHGQVCTLLERVAEEYSRENDVSALLAAVQEVLESMRGQELPTARREFESRAVLYYVLLRTEDFLLLKRQFHEEYAAEGGPVGRLR
ncbi:MAG: hypothetical protein IKK57_02680 [Clostridia bacterium]|nr:hypothetical protein [Clostridia bacterium]